VSPTACGSASCAIGAGASLGPHLAEPELMVSLPEPTQHFKSGRLITFGDADPPRENYPRRYLKAAR
jgi:hypothetical protein